MKLRNILAGAGVLVALAFANGASAATTYNLGVLSSGAPLSKSVSASGTVDDIFTFSIANPPMNTYGQLINAAIKGLSGVFSSGTIGLFTSGGVQLGGLNSLAIDPTVTGVTDTVALQPGDYYVEVKGTVADPLGANYTLGVFGAAVPEPATWAMMIVGLGMLGGAMRMSRRGNALTAA